jgi:diguanylate cyclase (GGDEF)-like protein
MVFSPDGAPLPEPVLDWLGKHALSVDCVATADELMEVALRARPRVLVFDGRSDPSRAIEACRLVKSDSYTGIIPAVAVCGPGDQIAAFEAGADEVIGEQMAVLEARTRLDVLLRRSDRDVYVHPSTRLPGTIEIEAEIGRRIERGEPFAVCYADLDHFKEYNDRYSYYEGDRVIQLLARILHDAVKGLCRHSGFVGHIGGDDFIFIIPSSVVAETCGEIVSVFDTLVPYQYSEQDRRAGYFFGKDRRGQLHRVPLMTVSIGVVTNERRRFTSAAQVSELATEMKSYAKTLPGSVYTIDRRQDGLAASGEHALSPRPDVVTSRVDEP